MTIYDREAVCDRCHATAALDGGEFRDWEWIVGRPHPEAHLCPRCRQRRQQGLLAEDFANECVHCGRMTIDHPKAPKGLRPHSLASDPTRILCGTCSGADPR